MLNCSLWMENNKKYFFFELSYWPIALCMLMFVPSVFLGGSLQELGA